MVKNLVRRSGEVVESLSGGAVVEGPEDSLEAVELHGQGHSQRPPALKGK